MIRMITTACRVLLIAVPLSAQAPATTFAHADTAALRRALDDPLTVLKIDQVPGAASSR